MLLCRQIDVQCALKTLFTLTTAQMDKEKNADKQNIQAPWVLILDIPPSWRDGLQSHPFVDLTF